MKHQPVKQGQTITGADPGFFFRRGCTRLLLYFNTNKPHSFFFWQNTSCIRKRQVISGGRGDVHPLHPPPRSAPALHRELRELECVGSLTSPADYITLKMQYTGPTIYRPYRRRLEHLTICRCHYKGSIFSSVILRLDSEC